MSEDSSMNIVICNYCNSRTDADCGENDIEDANGKIYYFVCVDCIESEKFNKEQEA